MDRNAPIGIFDSGVGGLTVAREVIRQLPNERFIYFGDTARVPYGTKSKDTIIKYTRQIIRFLESNNVKAIVVACNTASACALEEVGNEIKLPIIGVVKPGAAMAARATDNGKIGIIGTESTINSGIYQQLINKYRKNISVFLQACPLFVPLVEAGMLSDSITEEMAKRYLSQIQEKGIDTLVMGCTHYPLLRSTIRKILGESIKLINPAYETVIELKSLLEINDILNASNVENINMASNTDNEIKQILEEKYQFYVSDAPNKFEEFAKSISLEISKVQYVNIEEY
jgi:glutamate racemase